MTNLDYLQGGQRVRVHFGEGDIGPHDRVEEATFLEVHLSIPCQDLGPEGRLAWFKTRRVGYSDQWYLHRHDGQWVYADEVRVDIECL